MKASTMVGGVYMHHGSGVECTCTMGVGWSVHVKASTMGVGWSVHVKASTM